MRARIVLMVWFMLPLISCGDAENGGATATGAEPTMSSTPIESDPLVGRGEVELIDEGYAFTEGPQWMPEDGTLLFTDIPANTIHQVGADDEITVYRMPSNHSNGLAIDPEGRLIAAESSTRRVTRTERDGTITTIAERFEGDRLNEPNDIVVRSDGTIYFTDPLFQDPAQAELDFRGIFRIAPDGGLTAERRGEVTEAPNGLALSPDESLLYVTNYAAKLVWVMDVAPDGTLSEARTFVTTGGGPDGVAVDDAGNLFVATARGIEVFAPDGARWGVIPVPRIPSNCAFGGVDGRTLFITAEGGLYRVTLTGPGPY
jgi:gluconolactonase